MTKSQLLAKTKTELLETAKRLGLRGISTLTKPALAEKIADAQLERRTATPRKPRGAQAAPKKAVAVKRRAVRKPATAAQPKTAPRAPRPVKPAVAAAIAAHKFDLAPAARPQPAAPASVAGELPETYGTGRLFLTARDPHWVYAAWDLSASQLAHYRSQAADGRVLLRVFEQNHARPTQEIPLQADARNWYVYVNKADTTYTAELGYQPARGKFTVIARSQPTTTPPDARSAAEDAPFVTIPLEIPFEEIHGMVRDHLRQDEPLAAGLQRLQAAGLALPARGATDSAPWSDAQSEALTHLVWDQLLQRAQAGSIEISEWLRRQLSEELSSGVFSGAGFSPTSGSWQMMAGQPGKGFWFAVNAEVIIYGATEPNARVTIDGKPVALRPDGTFAFHYLLPDGEYRLPLVAISADGADQRAAELRLTRETRLRGAVGQVKQPAHLHEPVAV